MVLAVLPMVELVEVAEGVLDPSDHLGAHTFVVGRLGIIPVRVKIIPSKSNPLKRRNLILLNYCSLVSLT